MQKVATIKGVIGSLKQSIAGSLAGGLGKGGFGTADDDDDGNGWSSSSSSSSGGNEWRGVNNGGMLT